jgi:hypothetical protein
VLAGEVDLQLMPTVVQDRDRGLVHGPSIAPFPHREHDREQVAASFGQVVLKPCGMLAVLAPFDDPGTLQLAQPVREQVTRGTPMTAGLDVDKADPRDIVAAIYDGLEADELEVLADDVSRRVKQNLSQPLSALYPELAARN